MAVYIDYTTVDCTDSYAQSVWWSAVLDYTEDPEDPNAPGHEECAIQSADGRHKLLFIRVPEGKSVKNRIHFDVRPSTGTRDEHRVGTVGKPIRGVEVKIADDGEILTRGPHVMVGYWNLPEDTAQTIRDGWLHTGDLGAFENGYLKITGRKKELIVTAGGKNIAPSYLEGLLTEDPLIAQAVVVGDGQKYLTALIVPNPGALTEEIIKRGIPVFTPAQALAQRGAGLVGTGVAPEPGGDALAGLDLAGLQRDVDEHRHRLAAGDRRLAAVDDQPRRGAGGDRHMLHVTSGARWSRGPPVSRSARRAAA